MGSVRNNVCDVDSVVSLTAVDVSNRHNARWVLKSQRTRLENMHIDLKDILRLSTTP
jgi:hypothetical protein